MNLVTDPALQRFLALLREATGNAVPAARQPFFSEIAARRVEATGMADLASYARALAGGELPGEWAHLVPLVTVKESFFFRAPQQFRALAERILPGLCRRGRTLRVWSAGCARGEEPASLAMLLAERCGLEDRAWEVVATDLDEEALDAARAGLYGERAVANVPAALAARWLRRRGRDFALAPELLARIDYRAMNLARTPWAWREEPFDLILLRNVLIYFRRSLQRRVVAEACRHLAPGGWLLVGAAETLWRIEDGLEAVDLGDCFAYREPAASSPLAGHGTSGVTHSVSPSPALFPTPPAVSSPLDGDGVSPLPRALQLLAEGRLEEAERLAREAVSGSPGDPAAHAVRGVLHERAGRAGEAIVAYRAALYLDPALFQVRVLLADCFLRLGLKDRAGHQFREVLAGLSGGRARALDRLPALPLPDRDHAARRCRQGLRSA